MAKRAFDFVISLGATLLLSPVYIVIFAFVRVSSPGPALHWSKRIGKDNVVFKMPKFRTMRIDTPQIATHLMTDPSQWLTPVGKFLRATSLDELPQLWSVLRGQMSLVGPRPALFNQDDLKELRTRLGVHRLTPGLTGWAQINGRDELPIPLKVEYDAEYARRGSFIFDLKILFLTVVHALARKGVSH